MTFSTAIRSCFSKYVTFSGRATRPEFWYFILFLFIAGVVFQIIDGSIFGYGDEAAAPLSVIWSLATFLPTLAVSARRLHDIGRSAWWLLLMLLPLIGTIILIVWYCTKSQEGANDHGPDPHGLWT